MKKGWLWNGPTVVYAAVLFLSLKTYESRGVPCGGGSELAQSKVMLQFQFF